MAGSNSERIHLRGDDHVYHEMWTAAVGEKLSCTRETDNHRGSALHFGSKPWLQNWPMLYEGIVSERGLQGSGSFLSSFAEKECLFCILISIHSTFSLKRSMYVIPTRVLKGVSWQSQPRLIKAAWWVCSNTGDAISILARSNKLHLALHVHPSKPQLTIDLHRKLQFSCEKGSAFHWILQVRNLEKLEKMKLVCSIYSINLSASS